MADHLLVLSVPAATPFSAVGRGVYFVKADVSVNINASAALVYPRCDLPSDSTWVTLCRIIDWVNLPCCTSNLVMRQMYRIWVFSESFIAHAFIVLESPF